MQKSDAEKLGWVFHLVDEAAARFGAQKYVSDTVLEKVHDTLEKLLADLEAWEASRQPAAPVADPAPAPAADPVPADPVPPAAEAAPPEASA